MNIVILSKNPYIYSTDSISQELLSRNINVQVINPLECDAGRDNNNYFVYYNGKKLNNIDYVIPRIGSASPLYGLYIVEAFNKQGIKTLNTYKSIKNCRDKYQVYNVLIDNGLPTPASFLVKSTKNVNELVDKLNGYPVIAKLTRGSQGKGIMIAESSNSLKAIIDTIALLDEELIIQEFFETQPKYSDIRVYVLNNNIIGATQRINYCDFRSNTHCGGSMHQITIDNDLKELALKAVSCFQLNFCSIDFLITSEGPKILEINSTPGLEKAETEAKFPLSKLLADYIEHELCLTT